MSIAEKLIAAAENVPKVFAAGEATKAAEYDARQYFTSINGSGTSNLTVELPWVPDIIHISAASTRAHAFASYIYLRKDLRLFTKYTGCIMGVTTDGTSPMFGNMVATSTAIQMNGTTFVFTAPAAAPYNTMIWRADCTYTVFAAKYTDKTDKELLTEEIAALDAAGGTLTLSQARVNATVTEEEWAALIATQPNWTFTLV